MKKSPIIGVFDSGLGGLTVVKEIKKLIPSVKIIYLGDTARVPYGTRSVETIQKFANEDTKFLLSKKVDMIVIACNTVSAVALETVKKASIVPVYDVITPTLKKIQEFGGNKIGLIGTRATVNSNSYKNMFLKRHATILIPLIEEGFTKGKEVNIFIERYLSGFKGKIDTLILGCTHFPIIKEVIQKYVGKNIRIVDPATEVSESVFKELKHKVFNKKVSKDIFYLTDVNERFVKIAKIFLGKDISRSIKKVEL